MILMKDVYKTYDNGVTALNGINVDIEQGEFVYIVGPSGAGKSTFIKLIYREERPTSGSIIIADTDLGDIKERKVPFYDEILVSYSKILSCFPKCQYMKMLHLRLK